MRPKKFPLPSGQRVRFVGSKLARRITRCPSHQGIQRLQPRRTRRSGRRSGSIATAGYSPYLPQISFTTIDDTPFSCSCQAEFSATRRRMLTAFAATAPSACSSYLSQPKRRSGGIGIRAGFKNLWAYAHEGSRAGAPPCLNPPAPPCRVLQRPTR